MDWLMSHRTGHRWSPEKATGPAAAAVAHWFARTRFDSEHYKLTVFVNDYETKVLDVEADTGTLTVDVPRRSKTGKNRINFQLAGRGRYTFEAILSGFVAADKLKNTTTDWRVTRYHEPAPLELDGQEIPRGFGNLQGSFTAFRNPLTQLPVGKSRQCAFANRAKQPAGKYAGRSVGISRRDRAVAKWNIGDRKQRHWRVRAF